MIILLKTLGGGIAGRIRGGMGNEWVRKLLGKPAEWEIPNGIIRGICALYFCHLAFGLNPTVWQFLAVYLGVAVGYFKQVGEYFKFPTGFDLSKQENRSWKNYALLSARGMFTFLPAALFYPSLWLAVLAGGLSPLCYRIGFLIPEIKGVISHSQYGEFMLWSIIAAGVLL